MSLRAFKILGEFTRPLIELDYRWWTGSPGSDGGRHPRASHSAPPYERRGRAARSSCSSASVVSCSCAWPRSHDRTLDERRRDRFATSTPGGIVHQHVLVALEVAEKFADVSLKTVDAGYLAHVLALRPAVQARKFTLALRPAAVPQAPFRPLQITNCLVGKISVGRAETACRLQPMLKTNGDVPPVEHDRGRRQHLTLQPPQPDISITQHRRRHIGAPPDRGERLSERARRGRLAVA